MTVTNLSNSAPPLSNEDIIRLLNQGYGLSLQDATAAAPEVNKVIQRYPAFSSLPEYYRDIVAAFTTRSSGNFRYFVAPNGFDPIKVFEELHALALPSNATARAEALKNPSKWHGFGEDPKKTFTPIQLAQFSEKQNNLADAHTVTASGSALATGLIGLANAKTILEALSRAFAGAHQALCPRPDEIGRYVGVNHNRNLYNIFRRAADAMQLSRDYLLKNLSDNRVQQILRSAEDSFVRNAAGEIVDFNQRQLSVIAAKITPLIDEYRAKARETAQLVADNSRAVGQLVVRAGRSATGGIQQDLQASRRQSNVVYGAAAFGLAVGGALVYCFWDDIIALSETIERKLSTKA